MAFDEILANRVRAIVKRRAGFEEKKMFGGLGFLLQGNLCACVWQDYLILRLGIEEAAFALRDENVKVFDVTGKAMKGWVMVKPAGLTDDAALKRWIEDAIQFVRSLPAK